MKNNNNLEERREIVIDSINFYKKERNKALFQINSAQLKKKQALKDEHLALKRSRALKLKLSNEVKNNLDILSNEDLGDFQME